MRRDCQSGFYQNVLFVGEPLVVNRPRITGEKLIVPDKPWEDFYIGALPP